MPFPTTGVIDSFTRADESPLSDGGNWSQGPEEFDGASTLKLVSNQVAQTQTPDDVNTKGSAYRNNANYGPDAEAYVDVATVPEFFMSLYVRIVTPGVGTTDGYFIFIDTTSGTNNWTLARKDNNTSVAIGSNGSQAVAAGSKVGLRVLGTTLSAWYQPSGGSWTQVVSTTDTTYSAAGRIAMKMRGDLGRFDNFGGGTVVPTPISIGPVALTLIPTVSRVVSRNVSTALTLASTVSRVVNRTVSTALNLSASVTALKSYIINIPVALTLNASVTRTVSRTVGVALTLVPTVNRVIDRKIALAVTMTPSVVRVVQRTVGVPLSLAASVTRIIERKINTALVFAVTATPNWTGPVGTIFPVNITVPLNFAVSVSLSWAGGVVGGARRAKAFFFGRKGIY